MHAVMTPLARDSREGERESCRPSLGMSGGNPMLTTSAESAAVAGSGVPLQRRRTHEYEQH